VPATPFFVFSCTSSWPEHTAAPAAEWCSGCRLPGDPPGAYEQNRLSFGLPWQQCSALLLLLPLPVGALLIWCVGAADAGIEVSATAGGGLLLPALPLLALLVLAAAAAADVLQHWRLQVLPSFLAVLFPLLLLLYAMRWTQAEIPAVLSFHPRHVNRPLLLLLVVVLLLLLVLLLVVLVLLLVLLLLLVLVVMALLLLPLSPTQKLLHLPYMHLLVLVLVLVLLLVLLLLLLLVFFLMLVLLLLLQVLLVLLLVLLLLVLLLVLLLPMTWLLAKLHLLLPVI
jgi:hypothetical protein